MYTQSVYGKNLRIKLLKNPSKGPIMGFSRNKKKLSRTCRISSTLIVNILVQEQIFLQTVKQNLLFLN